MFYLCRQIQKHNETEIFLYHSETRLIRPLNFLVFEMVNFGACTLVTHLSKVCNAL